MKRFLNQILKRKKLNISSVRYLQKGIISLIDEMAPVNSYDGKSLHKQNLFKHEYENTYKLIKFVHILVFILHNN